MMEMENYRRYDASGNEAELAVSMFWGPLAS